MYIRLSLLHLIGAIYPFCQLTVHFWLGALGLRFCFFSHTCRPPLVATLLAIFRRQALNLLIFNEINNRYLTHEVGYFV